MFWQFRPYVFSLNLKIFVVSKTMFLKFLISTKSKSYNHTYLYADVMYLMLTSEIKSEELTDLSHLSGFSWPEVQWITGISLDSSSALKFWKNSFDEL